MENIIVLNKEDNKYCDELGKLRQKSDKKNWQKNSFRRGLGNIPGDEHRVMRHGLYGELAFSKWLGLQVDESISDIGDGGADFKIGKNIINVKFQMMLPWGAVNKRGLYGPLYIGATNQYGNPKPLKAHTYFFTVLDKAIVNDVEIAMDNIKDRSAEKKADELHIKLLGCIGRTALQENLAERQAKTIKKVTGGGNEYNYYVSLDELHSPAKFLKKARELLGEK